MVGVGGLTSTTAPGKTFGSRLELANHYKSDWHKYNLKRREAGMAMLEEDDFNARLEAALALRKEREGRAARSGTDHLKNKNNPKKKNKNKKQNSQGEKEKEETNKNGTTTSSSSTSSTDIGNSTASTIQNDVETSQDEETKDVNSISSNVNNMEEEEEEPTIDPRQCLFDNHMCASVEENVDRMYKKYGFFIPDREYLVDLEGLIGYCAEKIKLGHMCLYSQKTFTTWRGCQQHMIDTRQTKLLYERGKDQEEFDVFYDFTEADAEFLGTTQLDARNRNMRANQMIVEEEEQNDDDSGEWEDIDDDEEMEDVEEDDGIYGAYKDEIAKHGFDITPLGELVFPDGRIIGHRGLSRYYKQRFTSDGSNRTDVRAARRAAGERLYKGTVYETYQPPSAAVGGDRSASALILAKAGISRGNIGGGRMSRGILVPSGGSGNSSFTALSLYRYKAAVKKSRREENRGRRLQQRTSLPMNKMDKKANRLMNGVSVAHAAR